MEKRLMTKWSHYFSIYERHLGRFVNKKATLIEIGIAKGGSLIYWTQLLGSMATIVGIDVKEECRAVEEGMISVRIGNQADSIFLRKILQEFGPPDIIIDDGSHNMMETCFSFDFLYPQMKENGVYIVEDVHTSYWAGYGGGFREKQTFVEKSKNFVDELNAGHTNLVLPPTEFTRTTDSMHFYDSVVVFEKGTSKKEIVERIV